MKQQNEPWNLANRRTKVSLKCSIRKAIQTLLIILMLEQNFHSIMEFVADLLYDLPKNYGLAFDIVHYIVCLQGERLDMGLQFSETSQNHPLVSTKYTEQF